MIPNRSVVAFECGRYVFRLFVFDFSACILGSVLVSLSSSMRAGIGNAVVSAAEFSSSSLSLKEVNSFGRLV